MKYLLLIVVFLAVLWLLRGGGVSRRNSTKPRPGAPERMVVCAQCGVHLPVSESLSAEDRFYCCREHREQGENPRS